MKLLVKRLLDVCFSLFGLVILLPLLILIILLVIVDTNGGAFYMQKRVGMKNVEFDLYKFRTMNVGSDKKGLLTIGQYDSRITKIGSFLRKYKLDELPQLFNVLKGDMSLVGPRPEVRKYVDLYTVEQMRILELKPGITDYASLIFINENEILGAVENPNEMYEKQIMQKKLSINLEYLNNHSNIKDIMIILLTLKKILVK